MKQRKFKGLLYLGVIIVGLFLILFFGKTVDPVTKENQRSIVPNGIDYFKKGLDVAGGTKLVYTINYDKYKDVYTEPAEFQAVKNRIEDIIRRNIDGRIDRLGVSDYTSYYQTAGDKHYLVVEIGGILDLDQAKETIGKTLELEFRLPSDEEPSATVVLERKKAANDILNKILDDESAFQQVADARASENVFYGYYSGVTLAELPVIYQENIKTLESLELNKVYPGLIEGTYAVIQGQEDPENPGLVSEDTELKGFTFFRVLDKQTFEKTDIYPQDIIAIAGQYGLEQRLEFSKNMTSLEEGAYAYNASTDEITYYAANLVEGQEAYELLIYDVAKASTLGMSTEEADAEEVRYQSVLAKAQADLEAGKDPAVSEGVTFLMEDWTDLMTMQESIPEYQGQEKNNISVYQHANGSRLIKAKETKSADEKLAQMIILEGVNTNTRNQIEEGFKQTTTYTIEDVFVQDRQMWISAFDSKTNEILNGAYFEYASTDLSQIGEAVVAIKFDERGKEIFCNITAENIGTPMAIFAGGKMLTSPVIQSKICGGTAQIDGGFTAQSAKELADALNEWTMPASLILMQEEKISPTLGENALKGTIIAGAISIVIIIFLMWFMYGWRKAIVTTGVLLTFIIALLGLMKLTSYALSLSGIAAIILSIGMGVDANILIFERIREEAKGGRTMKSAIETGYKRSRAPIRDGNFSTAIIAALLFILGINMFKGFGMMMLINIILILSLNVPLTRDLLHTVFKRKSDYLKKSPLDKQLD